MAEEEAGFLGRWSRRKTDVLKGKPLEEPVAAPAVAPRPDTVQRVAQGGSKAPAGLQPVDTEQGAEPPKPLLSLKDVEQLTNESDFKPFMASDVGPEVRNAAMKKLFADPHYNVMDGLDIYIDDYSKSDPIPESMLRQMVGAKLLKIFDDEEEDAEKGVLKEKDTQNLTDAAQPLLDNVDIVNIPNISDSDTVPDPVEAVSPSNPAIISVEHPSQPEPALASGASQQDHVHSHLRLQPDHAASAPEAGHGTQ